MATLDIIVTHYNELNEIVCRFLTSLSNQSYEDYEVTIVDDGLDCPKLPCIDDFSSMKINHLKKDHHTVSAARNYGLDNTKSKYLMFCDCDDVFDDANKDGLLKAMWRIEKNNLNVYRSMIKVEIWKNNVSDKLSSLYKADDNDVLDIFYSRSINSSTVHCKIYNRKFITDNNIRFIDDLWMNEDGPFNNLAKALCKHKKLPTLDDCEFFYILKYNSNSVTRTNTLYPVLGYDQFLRGNMYTYEILLKNNVDVSEVIAELVFLTYYWLCLYSDKFVNVEGFNKFLDDDIEEFKKFICKFSDIISCKMFKTNHMVKYIDSYMKDLDKLQLSKKLSFEDWLKVYIKK